MYGMGRGECEDVSRYVDEAYLEANDWTYDFSSGSTAELYQDPVGYTIAVSGDRLKAMPYDGTAWPAFEVRIGDEYEITAVSAPADVDESSAYQAAENFVANVLEQQQFRSMDDPATEAQNRLQSTYNQVQDEDPVTIAREIGMAADDAYDVLDAADKQVKRAKLPENYSVPTHLRLWYGDRDQQGPGVDQFAVELDAGDGAKDTQIAYCIAAKMLRGHHKKSQTNNGFVHKDHHVGAGDTQIVDAFDQLYDDVRLHNSGKSS
jgi:hypothetical protein